MVVGGMVGFVEVGAVAGLVGWITCFVSSELGVVVGWITCFVPSELGIVVGWITCFVPSELGVVGLL